MKKSVAARWVFVVGFVVVLSFLTAEAKAQSLDRVLPLQNVFSDLKSPDEISKYLWKNFRFSSDRVVFGEDEYWQSPEEFIQNGEGDCEDFALFARQALKAQGINAFLLNIYGDQFAHTVCVFKENGAFHVIDRDKVIRYNAKDIHELMDKIYPHWKKGAIVTRSSTKKSARVLSEFEQMLRAQHRLSTSA